MINPDSNLGVLVAGKYFSLTAEQKLGLSSEELLVAVKLEAISRGIAPPLALEQVMLQAHIQGFSLPPESVFFWEIVVPNCYGTEDSGIAFRTEKEARDALNGAFAIYDDGYGEDKKKKIADSSGFTIRQIWINNSPSKLYKTSLREYEKDNKLFDAVAKECQQDLSFIRQERYDVMVNQQKRKEYMDLAKDNLEVAMAFWSKVERTEFPNAS